MTTRPGNVTTFRVRDLNRFFNDRYGHSLPDDDDAAREDIALMLAHLCQLTDGSRRMDHFLDLRAPWMAPAEREAAKQAAATSGNRWTSDGLAEKLGLTMSVRTRLGITTIGAIDCDRQGRQELRKQKNRERERTRRRKQHGDPKRRPPLSERGLAVLEVLDPEGWHPVSLLQQELRKWKAKEFAELSDASMRKAISRELKQLEEAGLIKTEIRPGTRGLSVLFATRDLRCTRETVTVTTTGTKYRVQR